MSIKSEKIKLVDVGVVFEGGGVIFCLVFLFGTYFIPAEFRGWILVLVGLVLVASGCFVFFKIRRVRNAEPIPCEVRIILVERFRRPGPAGVIPRFRIKVEMVGEGFDVKQSFVPFSSDNYYENLEDALLDSSAAVELKVAYFDSIFGVFIFQSGGF